MPQPCCRSQGTGKNCVKTADATGGPKCSASQTALCCDATQTSENCLSASGSACSDFDGSNPLTPFCCDQMDNPGCSQVDNGCNVESHPTPTRFCCAQAGNVTEPLMNYGDPIPTQGGLDCQNLYDMPSCPSNRPLPFCC